MRLLYLSLLFSTLLIFPACFQPAKACLDINATNFDASADENCCCKYPQLVINFDQKYDSTREYKEDSIYTGTGGHLFRIKKISFYFSDFQLFKGTSGFYTTDSTLFNTFSTISSDTLKELLRDDVLLLRRENLKYNVGAIREDGTFDLVGCRIGLPANLNRVVAKLAPSSHELGIQTDSLWHGKDKGFVFAQMIVVRDTFAATKPDTISLLSQDIGELYIGGSGAFFHPTGYDFNINMKADYKELFSGVDWTVYNTNQWKQQIVANLPNVFTFPP